MCLLYPSILKSNIKGAENIYAHLVMVSIWGRKVTLADKTVYQKWIDWYQFRPTYVFIKLYL